jgi:hypothetical protein
MRQLTNWLTGSQVAILIFIANRSYMGSDGYGNRSCAGKEPSGPKGTAEATGQAFGRKSSLYERRIRHINSGRRTSRV